MSEEESEYDEEEEEEEEEEVKDQAPNLNEFARFQQYGNYYRPGPFFYTNPQDINLPYNYNGYYPQPYDFSPQLNYKPNYSLQHNFPSKPYHPPQYMSHYDKINSDIHNLTNYAQRIAYNDQNMSSSPRNKKMSEFDEFQKYIKLKKQEEEHHKQRFWRGVDEAVNEQSLKFDWRRDLENYKKEQAKVDKIKQSQVQDEEYQEFLQFKKFRELQNQEKKSVLSKIPEQQSVFVEKKIIYPQPQLKQQEKREKPIQQNVPQIGMGSFQEQKQKNMRDLYKRKQFPQLNQLESSKRNQINKEEVQQEDIDKAIDVLMKN